MKTSVTKYIVLVILVLAIAFGVSHVRQNGMGGTIVGVTEWWNNVCEWFEDLTSKEEVTDSTEPEQNAATEPSGETVPEESIPEEQPPVDDEEPIFIENSDKSISMCPYAHLTFAQRNEQYDEEAGCGPFNIPHADEEVFPVLYAPCEQMETLQHNHDGQKVKMMINLNKVSVFCCNDSNADHNVGVWNLNKIFCVGFDTTRVEVCKTCNGLANGDKVIGEILEMELSDEDWAEIQKVACYWWETDEESGEQIRVFGLKTCTCEAPNTDKPTTPTRPSNPKPDDDNGGDDTEPTTPSPTDPTTPAPTDPSEPEHNPKDEPTKPEHNPKPTPVKPEPETPTTDNPEVEYGEPPVVNIPEDQPVVEDEPASTPVDNPSVEYGEPPVVNIPVSQPEVEQPAHNDKPVPTNPMVEAQPPVDEPASTPIENATTNYGEPPVVIIPEASPVVEETVSANREEATTYVEPPVVDIPVAQPDVEEPASAPVEEATVNYAEPPVVSVPEAQPPVESASAPVEEATVSYAEPPVVVVPEAQPPVSEPAHSEKPAPVAPVVEAPAPAVEVSAPVVEAQPAVEAEVVSTPDVDYGEPPAVEIP